MLFIREKDVTRRFKVYVNFRAKTIRVCNYFGRQLVYQVYLPFSKEAVELIEYGTYNDILQFVNENVKP